MKSPDPQLFALIGFAAVQWAQDRIGTSRHRAHYKRVIAAGLVVHEHCALYASAPKMRRALETIARHAAV
jgi:hypothetical protein